MKTSAFLAVGLTLGLVTAAYAQSVGFFGGQGVTQAELDAAAATNLTLMQQANASAGYVTSAQVAALAPVQSVNTKTGAVTVPTFERKTGTLAYASFTTSGGNTVGTWTYGSDGSGFVFSAAPKCFAQIRTTNTTVSYSYPVVTAVSASQVTFQFRVLPLSVSVLALGTVSLTGTLPTDTAMDILCLNPI